MKLLVIILSSVLLFSCVATCPPCPVSPPEDVIISTEAGPIAIEKGSMIPDNYYTLPEWQELIDAYEENLKRSRGF